MNRTISEVAEDLAAGRTSSEALVEQALSRIDAPDGEGSRTFITIYRDSAYAAAQAADAARRYGIRPSPLAGIPVSIKDLLDVRGEITRAGSRVLGAAPAASDDAPVVARLRAAGAVLLGRTNMTEFAFSGLGINPHYGTPRNPWDRESGRIPGGSSSGAAISVTDGMATVSIGTDTGGSVRIPSALCGLTGFKPTARRVPTSGAFPLSTTLDSIGPLARSVACCALVDQILSAAAARAVVPRPVATLVLGVPTLIVQDDMDDIVSDAFSRALSRLSAAGARVVDIPLDVLADIPAVNAQGGFAAAEAFATLREFFDTCEAAMDPQVASRVKRGAAMSAADYIDLIAARAAIQSRADAQSRDYDALLLPTVPTVAPKLAPLEASDETYHQANLLMLRNCSFGNFLDRCAVSLPVQRRGDAPVGLMIMGETMDDARLLEIAAGIEAELADDAR